MSLERHAARFPFPPTCAIFTTRNAKFFAKDLEVSANGGFVGPEMTTGTAPKVQLMRLVLGVLVVFSALCTIFVLVVTAAQAWQEHAQAGWPEVTARVDGCGLDQTSSGPRRYYIDCRLSYAVGAEQNVTNVYSLNVPSPEIGQYPPNQIAPFEEWVDEHPQGTPIVVRYDPADHRKAVLVATDMPRGGPRTPSNVKLLEVCAGSFLVLLTIARITRPRPQSL
jgi:hypothetical protein